MEAFQEGRRVCVRLVYGHPAVSKLRDAGFHWDGVAKYWWAQKSDANQKLVDGILQESADYNLRAAETKATGLPLVHAQSYICREQLKNPELGGVWDGIRKAWMFPTAEKLAEAVKICDARGPAVLERRGTGRTRRFKASKWQAPDPAEQEARKQEQERKEQERKDEEARSAAAWELAVAVIPKEYRSFKGDLFGLTGWTPVTSMTQGYLRAKELFQSTLPDGRPVYRITEFCKPERQFLPADVAEERLTEIVFVRQIMKADAKRWLKTVHDDAQRPVYEQAIKVDIDAVKMAEWLASHAASEPAAEHNEQEEEVQIPAEEQVELCPF